MTWRGSLHTGQISHLLLYASLWLLVLVLSSQFLPLFALQSAFDISTGQQYLWEMAAKFCMLQEPLDMYTVLKNLTGQIAILSSPSLLVEKGRGKEYLASNTKGTDELRLLCS